MLVAGLLDCHDGPITKRYTLDEIRAMNGMPNFSKLSTAEKVAQIAQSLERSRQRMKEQSRMLAWLHQRIASNEQRAPMPDLRTWDEVKAYVDRLAKGSDDTPD